MLRLQVPETGEALAPGDRPSGVAAAIADVMITNAETVSADSRRSGSLKSVLARLPGGRADGASSVPPPDAAASGEPDGTQPQSGPTAQGIPAAPGASEADDPLSAPSPPDWAADKQTAAPSQDGSFSAPVASAPLPLPAHANSLPEPLAAPPPPRDGADAQAALSTEPTAAVPLAPVGPPEDGAAFDEAPSVPMTGHGALYAVIGGAALVVGGGLAAGAWWLYSTSVLGGAAEAVPQASFVAETAAPKPEPTAARAGTPPSATTVSGSAAPSASQLPPGPEPSASAERLASAAPSADSAAAPADSSAPPADSASLAVASGSDASDLGPLQGYLIVTSTAQATVYATGVAAGPTNHKLAVKCGLRWVRLGHLPGPTWISEGKTVNVKCQDVTQVTLEPTP